MYSSEEALDTFGGFERGLGGILTFSMLFLFDSAVNAGSTGSLSGTIEKNFILRIKASSAGVKESTSSLCKGLDGVLGVGGFGVSWGSEGMFPLRGIFRGVGASSSSSRVLVSKGSGGTGVRPEVFLKPLIRTVIANITSTQATLSCVSNNGDLFDILPRSPRIVVDMLLVVIHLAEEKVIEGTPEVLDGLLKDLGEY